MQLRRTWRIGRRRIPRASVPVTVTRTGDERPLSVLRVATLSGGLLAVAPPIQANPIVVLPTEYGWVLGHDGLVSNFVIVVLSALCVEYLVFRHLFRKHIDGGAALAAFLDIHFVSWPVTFALSLILGNFNLFGLIPITEAFPIWYEGKRYSKLLKVRSSGGRRLMYRAATIANFTSYLFGLVYLRLLGH